MACTICDAAFAVAIELNVTNPVDVYLLSECAGGTAGEKSIHDGRRVSRGSTNKDAKGQVNQLAVE